MRKFCLLLAVCLMLTSLTGCGGSVEETKATEGTASTQESAQPIPTEATEPPVTEPPIPQVTGYDVQVPEGFEVSISEDDRMVYISPDAPQDPSTIVIEITDRDESILNVDETGFMARHSQVQEFRSIKLAQAQVDGIPALFADYTIKEEGVYTHIYEYHVVADKNYMFHFADSTDDNDWLERFGQAAATINMIMENEGIQLDYSGLEKYNLDCGISLYAVPGMQKQNAPGFTECIGSRKAIVLVMRDDKAANDLVGLSLQEYADLVAKANDLEQFTQDNYGNLHVNFYSTDSAGVEYYNNLTVKETDDCFWVFQMTCAAEDQASYDREFTVWATSIG